MKIINRSLRRTPTLILKEVKRKLYRILAKSYGFSYSQIARMNKFQQLDLLQGLAEEDDKTMYFSTMQEYMRWRANH